MIKSVKRLGAAVLSAVMMLTAVATPLGDNLPAVRESTSLTAGATTVTVTQKEIVDYVKSRVGGSYRKNYCLAFVADCFAHFGATFSSACCAKGYSDKFMKSTDKNIPLGADVFFSGGSVKCGNGHICGHIGIYVGNNKIVHASGGTIKETDMKYMNMKYEGWGWHGNIIVSDNLNLTDHYKLTSPDGYQTIRKEASTSSANLGSINTGSVVCVTKYSSDNKWGYLTYNGISGWIRLYYVEKAGSSHSYGSWYTTTSATCTSGGTEERKCSCGATESRSTSALGHNYGSWSTVTNATCTSGGSEKRTCSRCSNSETRSTSALGHNYGSTYFEAVHPHKYAHLCQRCGYKEFTGGNLAIYEKCDICYNENLPSKPCLNISSNGFKESDNVSFTWDPTDKTTHYNLTVEVLSGDEYKTVCRQTYVNSGFQATFGKGQYRAVLDSYNSNMFHQYTSDWRDWVHNSSDYVYFDIECAHEFLEEVVSPTYDNEGYTLHTCTKCGYSFQDDFVPALSHNKVTGLRAKVRYTNSLILAWDENEDAGGYEIEQYRDGDWQCIETIYDNTEVSYKVDDLRADTTYTFRIRPFVCIQDYNSYGEYTRLAAKTRIPNVTGLTSKSISSSTITLSWNKNNKATGYVIEQYKGGKWSGIATTKNNTTLSFTVKGLETDTTYTFRVKAYRTVNGKTEYSEYRRIQKTTAMDNVTGFKVKSTTSNSVTLTWNKTDRTTDYKIEQYKGGKWVDVDYISNEKSPVYTVTGLAPDTTYTFRIMALKITCMPEANNNSDYVRVAGKTRISNAAKFAGTALSNSAIKLVWSKNNMATGYVIEQYKGGKWTAIATTKNNTTLTFTVKGLAKGTTYSFRIKSFRKTGSTTEFSEYASVKVKTVE